MAILQDNLNWPKTDNWHQIWHFCRHIGSFLVFKVDRKWTGSSLPVAISGSFAITSASFGLKTAVFFKSDQKYISTIEWFIIMSHIVEMYFWVSWQGWIFSIFLICDVLGRFWLNFTEKNFETKTFSEQKIKFFPVCWFATIRSFVRFSLADQWKLPIIPFLIGSFF